MRDRSPFARRALAFGLVLSLILAAIPFPSSVLAQEVDPVVVSDSFEITGDTGDGRVDLVWTVTEQDVRWRLESSRAGESRADLWLYDADGAELGRASGPGQAALFDLALAPGDYTIRVSDAGDEPAFTLVASQESVRYDPEPNDRPEQAAPLTEGVEVTGRLVGSGGDEDRFAFSIGSGDSDLREIVLESATDAQWTLCLETESGERLQCRGGVGRVALMDLSLEPGRYLVQLRAPGDQTSEYRLRVDAVGPRPPDREAEPNDELATASNFDAALGVKGRSDRDDRDYHVVTIEGEPQLWQVRAAGPQVYELSLVRGSRGAVSTSQPGGSGEDAVLNDLILAPGDHVFLVRTLADDYTLTMTPLGPPDPAAEREPNDQPIRAEAYGIGERRTGRLVTDEDIDHFRFTLAAPDHLRLSLDQPADADLDLTITGGDRQVLRSRASAPGEPIDLDLALLPGDYLVRLRPLVPSEGQYVLTSERLDPFSLSVDQEPNDRRVDAQLVPPSLAFSGDQLSGEPDTDWFELPPLATPSTVTIRHSSERPVARFFAGPDGGQRLEVERVEEGLLSVAEVPAGTPLYLQLDADGPYQVQLAAEGWAPAADPLEPALEMTLELEHDSVAAYWPAGQRVAGAIALTNTGSDELSLALEAVTSHYGWQVEPASTAVTVDGGASVEVPLEVLLSADAWADFPVQITVAARTDDGGLRSAATVVEASREASAVGSYRAWSVPDELLGGLNVAGTALGGEPLGLVRADRELALFDGVTPTGAGFVTDVDELPAEFVVDLAGDAAVPVRGTIINPLAQQLAFERTPWHVELLLSTDGESWTPVLEEEILPLGLDQAFVLDEPVPATHAMLRVLDLRGEGRTAIVLGEWKVVAEPGAVPEPMPTDIAARVRGGHIARHQPLAGDQDRWYAMLDEDTRRESARFDPATQDELEIVIGFENGRAAQITGLSWLDPEGSDEETRVRSLEVEVGLDGPLGPWLPIGTWALDRSVPDVALEFDLEEPVWARFVRLRGALPDEATQVEFPATIEVFERATDEGYRSILGEWGHDSTDGPYEWLVPQAADTIELDPDAGDSLERATPLALGTMRADTAEILEDVDWYRIDVPAGDNTLELEVQGVPTVGVRLSLLDADGQPHEMRSSPRPGGVERYEAVVAPGTYHLRVDQPPFNVVFTFDTSGSMGPFLDYVLEGTREFAADVEPGREVAQIIPVGDPPLLGAWSDQPLQLQDAVNNFVPTGEGGASNVEVGLLAAAELLAGREGTRAILTVADAETGTIGMANDVWAAFSEAQPVVYAVHVGSSNRIDETRDLMRAWSDANGGVYSYPTSHAEMERSFERMSTRLRRPSTYLLTASTSALNRDPARLSVVAPAGQPAALAAGVGVGIILDTSGSMNKRLDGERRIDIAKASMKQLIRTGLADGAPVALRIFGGKGKKSGCQTQRLLELGPLDKARTVKLVNKLRIRKKTGTPIAAALRQVRNDLADVEGQRIVVLITDGKATCQEDPEVALAELRDAGIELSLNIVGFALDDEAVKEQMRGWAQGNDGSFYDATDADSLTQAVKSAVAAPVDIFALDDDTVAVARTAVGAPAVEIEPGTYRVVVRSDPAQEFSEVVLGGGEVVSLELPVASSGQ